MPVGTARESLESLLARMASASPAVGGGAAAALAAASAAALLAMVCGITARHDPAAEVGALAADADRLRRRLTAAIEDDVEAYQAVLAARRAAAAPGSADVPAALIRATEVPLTVARASAEVLDGCAAVAGRARPSTVGDLAVAAALAGAALESSRAIIRINLRAVDDAPFARTARAELDALAARADAARERLRRVVTEHA